jgi:hypothetical protein
MYHLRRDKLVGKPLDELFVGSTGETISSFLERCRLGETVRHVSCLQLDGQRESTPVELSLSLLTDDRNRAEAIAVIFSEPADRDRHRAPG